MGTGRTDDQPAEAEARTEVPHDRQGKARAWHVFRTGRQQWLDKNLERRGRGRKASLGRGIYFQRKATGMGEKERVLGIEQRRFPYVRR